MFNVHIPITSFQDPYDLQWPGCVMALLSRSMFNGPVLAPPLNQVARKDSQDADNDAFSLQMSCRPDAILI